MRGEAKSPYKRRAKQDDETLITGDNVSTEGIGKWPARPGTRLLKCNCDCGRRAWMMKYLPESPNSDTSGGGVVGNGGFELPAYNEPLSSPLPQNTYKVHKMLSGICMRKAFDSHYGLCSTPLVLRATELKYQICISNQSSPFHHYPQSLLSEPSSRGSGGRLRMGYAYFSPAEIRITYVNCQPRHIVGRSLLFGFDSQLVTPVNYVTPFPTRPSKMSIFGVGRLGRARVFFNGESGRRYPAFCPKNLLSRKFTSTNSPARVPEHLTPAEALLCALRPAIPPALTQR
jgi:hypothetical protein